jgi:hypothetical protein
MTLAIEQEVTYTGDRHWKWSVWIDGPEAELDQVESVEYVLHPTFAKPVSVMRDRAKKFRLDAAGWGEFELYAHVTTKDGRRQRLKHWLRLEQLGGALAGPGGKQRPSAFVFAGVADIEWEEAVRSTLAQHGCEVLTTNDVPAGPPPDTAISSTLDKANLVVGIFSEKSGPWAEREVDKALEKDIPVFPLIVGAHAKVPASLKGMQAVYVADPDDVSSALGPIIDRFT